MIGQDTYHPICQRGLCHCLLGRLTGLVLHNGPGEKQRKSLLRFRQKNPKEDIESSTNSHLTDAYSHQRNFKLLPSSALVSSYTAMYTSRLVLAPTTGPFFLWNYETMYAKNYSRKTLNGFEPARHRTLARAGFEPARCNCAPAAPPLRQRLVVD